MAIWKHTPRTWMSKNISFLTTWFMESQVSGLAKFGPRKSMDLPNLDLESHAMSVTCITKLIILQTTHNMFHIAHIIIHITHNVFISFIRMPWDLGIMDLTLRLPNNEVSTYGTSTRESALANTEYVSFIHMYLISFHSWASVNTSYTEIELPINV